MLSALYEACCEAVKCEFLALRPPGTLEPYKVQALGIEQMVPGAGKGYMGLYTDIRELAESRASDIQAPLFGSS